MEMWQLQQLQGLPLEVKIEKSKQRIKEWYEHWEGNVYVSFSGGKDSTVLLHLVRSMYPDIEAVFVDTGLEYPEIREFVKSIDNVIWLRPKMTFKQVIEKYGYPVASKKIASDIHKLRNNNLTDKYRNYLLNGDERGSAGKIPERWKCLINAPFESSAYCCNAIKKSPLKKYAKKENKKPITGEMADEGGQRERDYIHYGCNAFDKSEPKSTPLGFWTENNIYEYIKTFGLSYSKIYGDIVKTKNGYITTGEHRTGCMFCMFGCHLEQEPNRFQRMQKTHPQLWEYCICKLGLKEVLDYIQVPYRNDQINVFDYLKEVNP